MTWTARSSRDSRPSRSGRSLAAALRPAFDRSVRLVGAGRSTFENSIANLSSGHDSTGRGRRQMGPAGPCGGAHVGGGVAIRPRCPRHPPATARGGAIRASGSGPSTACLGHPAGRSSAATRPPGICEPPGSPVHPELLPEGTRSPTAGAAPHAEEGRGARSGSSPCAGSPPPRGGRRAGAPSPPLPNSAPAGPTLHGFPPDLPARFASRRPARTRDATVGGIAADVLT